jgi:hypothetical protein
MTMLAAANRDESRWNDPDHSPTSLPVLFG